MTTASAALSTDRTPVAPPFPNTEVPMDYILLLGWLATCAVQDAHQRKIANTLTFGMLAVALLYLAIVGNSLLGAAPGDALAAMAIACLLSLPGYLARRMGAGDVKMLIALGAATDMQHVLFSVIGAALAQCLWLAVKHLFNALTRHADSRPVSTNKHPVYAPFLCVGFALTAAWSIIN